MKERTERSPMCQMISELLSIKIEACGRAAGSIQEQQPKETPSQIPGLLERRLEAGDTSVMRQSAWPRWHSFDQIAQAHVTVVSVLTCEVATSIKQLQIHGGRP